MDKDKLINQEIEFASTISEDLLEDLDGWELNECPYCNGKLWYNYTPKKARVSNGTHHTIIRSMVSYYECPNCKISLPRYTSEQVPRYKISSALLLVIVFTPDLDCYMMEEIFGISRYTVKSIRKVYKPLIDILLGFKKEYEPKDYIQFVDYYEDDEKFNAYQKKTNIIMPTGENANWWIYTYIKIKVK